jgi:hypothetical protein
VRDFFLSRILLYCHALREIPWLIDITSECICDIVREELEYDHLDEWRDERIDTIELDHVIIEIFGCISSCDDTDDFPTTSLYLFDARVIFRCEWASAIYHDRREILLDECDRSVF